MKYTTYFSICLALRRKKVYTLITVYSGKVVWKKDQIDNMEEEMKKMVKRTAVVTLAGVMSVGMLSGRPIIRSNSSNTLSRSFTISYPPSQT